MIRLLVGVLAVAWVFAGWKNLPRMDQPQAGSAGIVIAVSVLVAFWAGGRWRRGRAVAAAVAVAEAHALASVRATTSSSATADQRVQVVVVDPSLGAARMGEALIGLDEAPWLVQGQRRVELDEMEAVETALSDVLDHRESEEMQW